MTIITTASSSGSADSRGGIGPLQEIRWFWHQFIVAAFNPYRPELHYMRGPGPAWRAKNGLAPRPH